MKRFYSQVTVATGEASQNKMVIVEGFKVEPRWTEEITRQLTPPLVMARRVMGDPGKAPPLKKKPQLPIIRSTKRGAPG